MPHTRDAERAQNNTCTPNGTSNGSKSSIKKTPKANYELTTNKEHQKVFDACLHGMVKKIHNHNPEDILKTLENSNTKDLVAISMITDYLLMLNKI